MKLDDDTRKVMKILIEEGFFIPSDRCIDISKLLDVDKKLDLWLLEVTIRASIKFLQHALAGSNKPVNLGISGIMEYCAKRDIIWGTPKATEEYRFIFSFKENIIKDELSPG